MSWPGGWFSRNIAARIDPWLLRATGGRLESSFGALPVILLISRGARSQDIRHTPVLYFTHGSDVVLIASSFGQAKHPAWYHNLRAHPEVWLKRRGREGAYRACEVTGSERENLYALGARVFGGYGVYAERARGTREIPVLRLSPLRGGPASAGELFAQSKPVPQGGVVKHQVHLPQGTICFSEAGTGEALIFLHPIVTNSLYWRKMVPQLSKEFRCITPDWPMGSHSIPMERHADFSLPGLAKLVVDFMDAIELDGVTLVGNDTGGAIAQQVAVDYPSRVNRLVLCSCELYERFLPPQFKPLQYSGYVPGSARVAAQLMRFRWVQGLPVNYGGSMKKGLPERSIMDAYLLPSRQSAGVRRDFAKFLRAVDKRYTLHTAEMLKNFDKPVLVAWAGEDKLFPLDYPRRFAASLPNARLEVVPDCRTFVAEDQPGALAEAIQSFVRESAPALA